MATSTISGDLIEHVRIMYMSVLNEAKNNLRQGINIMTRHGITAYIIAVASVESFVNEAFLTPFQWHTYKKSSYLNLSIDWLQKIELSAKLIIVPQLLFDKSFSRNIQPYQDMSLLIKIRNDIIHYKWPINPPKYVNHLSKRGIAYTSPNFKKYGVDQGWPDKINCSEGIRWAHNTACLTIQELLKFVNNDERSNINGMVSNFTNIPDSIPIRWLIEHGIDPKSNYPA